MTCITGLTAQNTQGVDAIYPIKDESFVRKCIDAVASDVGIDAVKTGMLATAETVRVVGERLGELKAQYEEEGKKLHIVVDPVMVSTSGANLIPEDAIDEYIDSLIPLATVFTPNIVETKFILKRMKENFSKEIGVTANVQEFRIESLEDMKEAAETLYEYLECDNVLVKGGHLAFTKDLKPYDSNKEDGEKTDLVIVDVLFDGTDFTVLQSEYLSSKSTHGTGCTLSSAIASNLAKGKSTIPAIKDSIHYVQRAIKTAYPLGKGFGPVNHMHNIQHMPFIAGKFLNYLLEHPKIKEIWHSYVNHPFTKQLAYHTLPLPSFKYFLQQDYLYLKHYSRCYGLSVYKANDMETINKAASVIQHINTELKLHVDYCKSFGMTAEQLEHGAEGIATYAYSRYMLDVGSTEDWFSLQVALSPCLFGYLDTAKELLKDPKSVREGNPYWKWVENYSAEDYVQAAAEGRDLLESHAKNQSIEQIEKLVDIFATSTKMEIAFWDAALAVKE